MRAGRCLDCLDQMRQPYLALNNSSRLLHSSPSTQDAYSFVPNGIGVEEQRIGQAARGKPVKPPPNLSCDGNQLGGMPVRSLGEFIIGYARE